MAMVDMQAMLRHAYQHRYAIGSFEIIDLPTLKAAMEAAERCEAPLILSVVTDGADLELLMPAAEAAARRARVPVAIEFRGGTAIDPAIHAIRLGCNAVAAGAAGTSLEGHIEQTGRVVATARGCGVAVEGALTPPMLGDDGGAAAEHYVKETGVDVLAVPIAPASAGPSDLARLAELGARFGIPLAIAEGVDAQWERLAPLIGQGVAKIHTPITAHRGADAHRMGEASERLLRLTGSAGRAGELLLRCPPWDPVEHLIVFNVEGIDEAAALGMMAEGRRALAAIPGVRAVETGAAIAGADARYRYCWLVRFAHPAVIATYRDHPLHIAFADRHFRPVAGDRITIDYRLFSEAAPVRTGE